ncbi:MAG: hypothetical protein L3J32_04090, partial [Rhizobiaceae bacterium]|nr:hypothetical protein [Rhizobiaceae bacterium]
MLTRTTDENQQLEEASQKNVIDDPQPSGIVRKAVSVIARGAIQIILMVAVLAGSYIGMNRLIDAKPEVKKRSGFRTVYTVQTVPVKLADYRPTFTVYGESIASRTVDLRSLVAGEAISVSPNLKAGARVAKGEALMEIDPFNY